MYSYPFLIASLVKSDIIITPVSSRILCYDSVEKYGANVSRVRSSIPAGTSAKDVYTTGAVRRMKTFT